MFDDSTVTRGKAIRSPAFKAGPDSLSKGKLHAWWHSVNPDSVSKVVDKNGEPMVVYHASSEDFGVFTTSGDVDGGSHFGTKEQARDVEITGDRKLREFFIKMTDPERLQDLGYWKDDRVRDVVESGYDEIIYLNRREGVEWPYDSEEYPISDEEIDGMTDSEFKKIAPEAKDSYMVFSPNQIKSATGNEGMFSGSNNITLSIAPITQSAYENRINELFNGAPPTIRRS